MTKPLKALFRDLTAGQTGLQIKGSFADYKAFRAHRKATLDDIVRNESIYEMSVAGAVILLIPYSFWPDLQVDLQETQVSTKALDQHRSAILSSVSEGKTALLLTRNNFVTAVFVQKHLIEKKLMSDLQSGRNAESNLAELWRAVRTAVDDGRPVHVEVKSADGTVTAVDFNHDSAHPEPGSSVH
jgi:hypothetical protein